MPLTSYSATNPILGNHQFKKQFPKFSQTYAKNFEAYNEIANDNWAFLCDYNNISLYKKVPANYQKIAQSYGTTDYKELDPRLHNLF